MKLKSNFPAVLAALVTTIMPAMALTWNDGGPTHNWSTAAGDSNWTDNVTWTNGSAADFAASGTDTIALATAGMSAGTVTFGAGGASGTSVQYTVPTGSPKRFVRLRVMIP